MHALSTQGRVHVAVGAFYWEAPNAHLTNEAVCGRQYLVVLPLRHVLCVLPFVRRSQQVALLAGVGSDLTPYRAKLLPTFYKHH